MRKYTAVFILIASACGDLDAYPSPASEPVSFNVSEQPCPSAGAYDSDGQAAIILDLSAAPYLLTTSRNQNAWLHVFSADDQILAERFIIGDTVVDLYEPSTAVIRPHRDHEWTLSVECL